MNYLSEQKSSDTCTFAETQTPFVMLNHNMEKRQDAQPAWQQYLLQSKQVGWLSG